ncbi:RagB/SusD family nutrient uptake outer membrane protein [Ekhidna sp.]|uniref:RagB/SusD family nutrient uptake outer membrane protein n=1 Tax=Ekhidna sp. TaxID=2608089 RepID=UPI0032EB8065
MKKILIVIIAVVVAFGCEIDEQININAPALDDILESASKSELNNLTAGAIAGMRNGHSIYVTATGTITRELYLFDADPRNRTDLIGTEGSLDNNSFYTTANWTGRYRVIKNCNILLDALAVAEADVTEAEKQGYRGFAKTIMAHQLLVLWGAYHNSGVRLEVSDPDNPGPVITDPDAVLQAIRDMLDDGANDLSGASFAFALSSGFQGFDTPATFSQFNRALAARAALYAGDMADAITHLGDSFYDINGDLTTGPKMPFSTSPGDLLNDLFKTSDQNGNQIFASDTWVNEAMDPSDLRLNKVVQRDQAFTASGITVNYETELYASSISSIDIIRNEELILIYAEANIGIDNNEALAAINRIRTEAGLATYPGTYTVTVEDILDERRYSFWCEGHRMVDLRRTGNLNESYITFDNITTTDADGNVIPADQEVFTEFPLPLTEIGS